MSGVSFLCAVSALTLAIQGHELPLRPFVASAAKTATGEVWRLPASALVVDRPVDVGLAAFIVLGLTSLRICGARIFWIAAAAGHIGSTLTVYAIIEAARLTDPDRFASAVITQDFGASAMQGAWVGSIAAAAWIRAGADHRYRALVASGVCALAGIAWWLHPDPSILTTEHLFAFLFGCALVSWSRLVASVHAVVGRLFPSPHPPDRRARVSE